VLAYLVKNEVIGDVIADVSNVRGITFICRVKHSMKFSFIVLQHHREKSKFRQYSILNITDLPNFFYILLTVHHVMILGK